MTWNHRVVVKREYEPNEIEDPIGYQIHECYYGIGNDPDKVDSITKNPITPYGTSLEELKKELKRMLKACDEPVLNYENF